MTAAPAVWIVVVNWNRCADTLRCLASVDDLDYPNYRVVVVDNGSQDDSERRLRSTRPDIVAIQTGTNRGYAGGNNVGIRYALERGADYVWVLNNDTVVRPDALSAAVSVAEAEPAIGIVGSSQFTSARPWEQARLRGTAARHAGRRDTLVSCEGHEEQGGVPHHRVSFASGGALLLRSVMLQQVGVFDERYFHYAEEVDLGERATAAGWHVALACRSHVWHAFGGSLPEQSPQALYYRVRNFLLMKRKLAGRAVGRTLWSEPRFTYESMKAAARLRHGEWRAPVAVLLGLMDAMRRRTGRRELGERFQRAPAPFSRRRPARPYRVVFLSNSAQLAGAERSLLGLMRHLDRNVVAPIVLLPRRGPLEQELQRLGVPYRRLPYEWWIARRNRLPLFAYRLARTAVCFPFMVHEVRKLRPDLIYTNSLVIPEGAVLAGLLGKPHIWHVREVVGGNATLRGPLPARFVFQFVRRASARVIAVSDSVRSQFAPDEDDVKTIYDGIDSNGQGSAQREDRATEISKGEVRVALVGSLSVIKRQLEAVKTVEILRGDFPQIVLSLVGDGPPGYRNALETYIEARGLANHVALLGQVPDTEPIFRASDLSLMLCDVEAFGLVTIESLAAGTPVVGVDGPCGTPEILRRGGGVLVPAARPELLAAAIRELLRSPDRLRRLRAEAPTVAAAFSMSRCAALIQNEIVDVIERR